MHSQQDGWSNGFNFVVLKTFAALIVQHVYTTPITTFSTNFVQGVYTCYIVYYVLIINLHIFLIIVIYSFIMQQIS